MQQSETIAQLAAAFAKAQASIEAAKKDAENPFFKSKYADLGEVWRVVKDAFSPHGLSVIQLPETDPEAGTVTLTTILLHESGEWLSGTMPVRVVKDDPQGVGSGITYARRYALAGLCGVVSETDDDGEGAMARDRKPTPLREATIGDDGKQRIRVRQKQAAQASGLPEGDIVAETQQWVAAKGKARVAELTPAEEQEYAKWLTGFVQASKPAADANGSE